MVQRSERPVSRAVAGHGAAQRFDAAPAWKAGVKKPA
jgi:hypothetical protein